MSTHIVNLAWERSTKDFNYKTYNRNHNIVFPGGETIEVTATPEYFGNAHLTNPEELLITALSSCFLLTFLAIASNKGFIVNSYVDQAEGLLSKNTEGKFAVTDVTLKPIITFEESKQPDTTTLNEMLEKAHANCFIANSVKTAIHIKHEAPYLESDNTKASNSSIT